MTANPALVSVLSPIISNIVEPTLLFLFALALVYFVWGVFVLIRDAASEDGRRTGALHILYSAIGMFIMIGAYGLIRVIASTLNVQSPV
jgi:hypothetical protein